MRRKTMLLPVMLFAFSTLVGTAPSVQPTSKSSPASDPLEPIAAILDAFRTHQLVAIGDAHGNQQGHAFQLSLIRDARFAAAVTDIVVELGNSRHQDVLDRFVRGEDVPRDTLRRVWHDTSQQQAAPWEMPEIFGVVREINRSLSRDRQLRVLLAEPPIDWDSIRTPEDFRKWDTEPSSSRDRFAADLIRREVLGKQRRGLALFGAGHFFRKNVTHSLVSLLEDAKITKAFTIWTNAAADMAAMHSDVANWRVPSLAIVRGTVLGQTDFAAYFGPGGGDIPQQWRVPMQDQFDAVLYLRPLSNITFSRGTSWPCGDAAFVERLRRVGLSRAGLVERLKQQCVQ